MFLGLASLYHILMKSPKTVYLTEQCQLMSLRNSVLPSEEERKCKNVMVLVYKFDSVLFYAFKAETAFLSFYRLNNTNA